MKLAEMADVLDGLANTMEKFLGKTALNDMRQVSECFRKFASENVGTFCNAVIAAKEGRTSARGASAADAAKVDHFVQEIRRLLDNRNTIASSEIDEVIANIKKLKVPEIKAIGEQVECPLKGTKDAMVNTLRNWLNNIKLSADQTSFSLTAGIAG
jgi:hypothetical protein